MLVSAGIIVVELLVLLVLSRALLNKLYAFFFLLTRSRPAAVSAITLLTFPGTIIHELSHLFTAEILGVRTGKLSLAPESIREPEIKAGSVMIAQTDPFRRTAIGTAPITGGIIALFTLSYFLMPTVIDIFNRLPEGTIPDAKNILATLGILYLLFAISNSMFASREDLKGAWAVFIVLGLIAAGFYYAGVRLTVTGTVEAFFVKILGLLSQSLAVVLILNLAIMLTVSVMTVALTRIFRIRIVKS